MIRTLVPLPIAVPMIVAALLSFATTYLPKKFPPAILAVTAVFNTWCTAILLWNTLHQPFVYWFGNWWPRGSMALGECFVIAPLPAALAFFVSLLTLFASILSFHLEAAGHRMEPLMLLFMAAMCGFAYSGDIFNLFVWFELMSAAAFALCGLKTAEPAPLQGAFNFAITNTVGAFFIITGLALVYARTGALNMAQIGRSLGTHADALVLMSFLLMTVGYMIKGAIVPFHLWLADAHAVAPTPVCVLFSGIMVELGIYAVARIYWAMFQSALSSHTAELRGIYVALGVLTALVGGTMCFAQHNLKRLLAYSTICHAGLMLIGVGMFESGALGGYLLYVLGHGLVKGGLFACAGIVLHRLRYIGEHHLHGRGRGMVWTPLLFMVGAAGLAAAPGFLLESGESAITHSAAMVHLAWVEWIFFFGGITTGAAVLRFTFRTFFGWGEAAPQDRASRVDEKQEIEEKQRQVPATFFIPAACMVLLGISTIFIPHIRESADASARLFTNQSAYEAMVIDGSAVEVPRLRTAPPESESMLRGILAVFVIAVIAFATVFRRKNPLGSALHGAERGVPFLRAWQSGHPGDYVTWITVGTAVLGGCFVLLLR
ncbi:MAG TPA: complex I subunit 5 family protein [Terriglobales bacterium]|nr:complex I subunit 5 family protein [Terriglobales bacterium]